MFVKLIFKLSSIFYQLVLLCGFQLTGCKTLPNISSFLLLSNQFLTFFRFFISPLRIAAFQLTKCKTSPNISSDFDLSNHFHVFCVFFYIFRKNIAFSTQNKQKSSSPPPTLFRKSGVSGQETFRSSGKY